MPLSEKEEFELLSLEREKSQATKPAKAPTIDAIPGPDGKPVAPPKPEPKATIGDKVKGAGEAALSVATGIPAGVVGNAQALIEDVGKRATGGTGGPKAADARAAELTQRYSYEPKTEKGKEYVGGIGRAVDATGIAGLAPGMVPAVGAAQAGKTGGAFRQAGKEIADVNQAKLAAPMARQIGKAQEAGLTMPPTQANPSAMNKILEGISGKTTTAQKASEKNAPVINKMAREALGLPEGEPITVKALEGLRAQRGGAYEAIKQVTQPVVSDTQYLKDIHNLKGDFSAAAKEFPQLFKNEGIDTLVKSLNAPHMSTTAAVELIKKLRFDSNALLKSRDNPQNLAIGMASRKAADAIEGLLERKLEKMTGDPNMVKDFQAARQLIAASYDVEAALNESTGNVSGQYLAKLLDKGKPLSGNLRDVAEFSRTFPKAAQSVEKIGSQPGISPLDVGVQMLRHASGAGLAGDVASMGVRPAARAAITSAPYQKAFVGPPKARTAVGQNVINRAKLGYEP